MEITLKRIKRASFDEAIQQVLDNFEKTKQIIFDGEKLEEISEEVKVDGECVKFEYNVDEYLDIVNSSDFTYNQLAQVGMKLHKDSKDINGKKVSKNIFYEKEVWAYLSFKVFAEVIKKLRLEDDDKINPDKIKRFYFNTGNSQRSRTGLLFVWSMIDVLNSEDNPEASRIAFHFIDPVKAIYERAMSRNPIILQAFVEAIIKNKEDSRIKSEKYKAKVPKHISCCARINIMDAYEYSELVNIMTEEIANVINM